jgi:hypothetical protein
VRTVSLEIITPKQFVGLDLPSTMTLTSHGNCSSMVLASGLARPHSLKLKFPASLNSIKKNLSLFRKWKTAFNFLLFDISASKLWFED